MATAGRAGAAGGQLSRVYPIESITYLLPWLFDWSVVDRLPEASCAAFFPLWVRAPQLPGLDFRSGAHSFAAPS